uniref:hypothetical protein n=1 Tax=Jatropha curcas TaxID=180498 RepID=UPI0027A57253|nr:hypothetical protein QLP06_mgp054 [Jatropha curcas]WFG81185.1 hypothetical protein [Jatropha curcas]
MQPLPLKTEGRQCPRLFFLFQRESSWRPRTMTSSSSIPLRARDFYASRYSRLCYERKRQTNLTSYRCSLMRDFKRLIREHLSLLHPSAEGFSIHLRRYFQIARHNLLYE